MFLYSRFEVPFGLSDVNKRTILTGNFVNQVGRFIMIYFIFKGREKSANCQKWFERQLTTHCCNNLKYGAKTKSAPKLEIKKTPGMEKGRCPVLEFQMQNGEHPGTDPPPSLAKKKKRKR